MQQRSARSSEVRRPGLNRSGGGGGAPAKAMDETIAADGLQQRAATMFLAESGLNMYIFMNTSLNI